MTIQWHCLGTPPHTPACQATGATDSSADRHTRDTGHSTTTSLTGVAVGKEGER